MSKFGSHIAALLDRWFEPRELIIRTQKGVAYIRLSRTLQMGVAGLLSLFLFVFTLFSLTTLTMTYLWQDRGERLTEMQLAYSGLVSTLKDNLPENAKAARALINGSPEELAEDFLKRMDESQAAIQLMGEEIARLGANVRRAEVSLTKERKNTGDLEDAVATLEGQLQLSQARDEELQETLKYTDRALKQSIEQQHQMEMAKNDAENALRDATQRLNDVKTAYSGMLADLTERAHSSLEEMEKIIAKAGLKVEDMLAQVSNEKYGQGGPFIPVSKETIFNDQSVVQHVAPLDDQVSRLEKLHVILRSLPLSAPVDRYYVSSGFGGRADPLNGESGFHVGLDMVGTLGSDVLSTAPGKVVFAGWRGNYGKVVEIDHGFGLTTVYAHLKQTLVEKGDEVSYRQKIGLLGNTGRSSGPHIHYEIRYRDKSMNPDKFLQAGRYVFKG